jgi:hypothetical protein
VLSFIRDGLTDAEIAVRLGISPDTVKFHVSRILSKLRIRTREDAAQWESEKSPTSRLRRVQFPFSRTAPFVSKAKIAGAAGIVAAGFIAVVLTFISRSTADQPPTHGSMGKLAYIQNGNPWVKDLPDGNPVQLTHDGEAWLPTWSPSGEWLTESSNEVSRILQADGSRERLPLSGGFWSPVDDVLAVPTDRGFRIEAPEGTILYNVDLRTVARETRTSTRL